MAGGSAISEAATVSNAGMFVDAQGNGLGVSPDGELCSAIALGFGATATLHYERMYPATINTAQAEECRIDLTRLRLTISDDLFVGFGFFFGCCENFFLFLLA